MKTGKQYIKYCSKLVDKILSVLFNDVLVFNFLYRSRWDSLGLNLKTYYVKRCVAMSGDSFEDIREL